jgi:hypothetical protein
MRHYQVIAKAICYVCIPKRDWMIDDPDVHAANEASVKDAFEHKHKLCPYCLHAETKATVSFEYIYIDELPRRQTARTPF